MDRNLCYSIKDHFIMVNGAQLKLDLGYYSINIFFFLETFIFRFMNFDSSPYQWLLTGVVIIVIVWTVSLIRIAQFPFSISSCCFHYFYVVFFSLVFSPSLRCDLQFDKILSDQSITKIFFQKQKEYQFRRLGFLIFIYVFFYVLFVFRVRLCGSDAIKLNTLRSNSLMLLTDL